MSPLVSEDAPPGVDEDLLGVLEPPGVAVEGLADAAALARLPGVARDPLVLVLELLHAAGDLHQVHPRLAVRLDPRPHVQLLLHLGLLVGAVRVLEHRVPAERRVRPGQLEERADVVQDGVDVEDQAGVALRLPEPGPVQPEVHIAVGCVVRDLRVPGADLEEGIALNEGEVIVREEVSRPGRHVGPVQIPQQTDGTLVDGGVGIGVPVMVAVLLLHLLVGEDDDVLVAPEEVLPAALEGGVEVEVLQLRKGEEGGRAEDVNSQDVEGCDVEEKGVLERELVLAVRGERPRVLYHEDVRGWPTRRDVAAHAL